LAIASVKRFSFGSPLLTATKPVILAADLVASYLHVPLCLKKIKLILICQFNFSNKK